MEVLKKYKSQIIFHIFLNVLFGLLITYSTFYHVPLSGVEDRVNYLALLLIIQFTVFGFLYFLSLNKYVFYLLFPPLFLVLSLSAFWVYSQDIIINEGVVKATLETKSDVVADLVSLPLIIYFVLIIVLLFWIFKKYKRLKINSFSSPLTILGFIAVMVFIGINLKKQTLISPRLPYNVYFSIKEYYQKPVLEFEKINKKLISRSDTLQVIFVIGESVRADHLSLNGYHRNTMPNLSNEKNVVSFKNVFTNKTYTSISIPQILSSQSVKDTGKYRFMSIIDILNVSEIKTGWIGNQTPEKGYEYFINRSQYKKLIDPYHSEFSFHKELDEKMLPFIRKEFSSSEKQFLTVHMMGSHWFYENRYEEKFRKFRPVIHSKFVKANSSEEMINSYDNTILYLDDFLAQIIQDIKKNDSNTVLIYLSDHGEALGENGHWLHAQVAEPIKNPALIFWFSDKFSTLYPNKVQRVTDMKDNTITTDFFYHTILGLFDIEGIPIQQSENIFAE